jgi:Family of unknown function (DUF6399)
MSRATSAALRARETEAKNEAHAAYEAVRRQGKRDRPIGPMPEGVVDRVEMLWRDAEQAQQHAAETSARRSQMRQAIRDVSAAYHPFCLATGAKRDGKQVETDLLAAHAQARKVGHDATLAFRAQEALAKAARLVPRMTATIGFFHATVTRWVTEATAELTLQTLLLTVLLPFFYLQKVACTVACRQARATVQATVARLAAQLADPSGVWAQLAEVEQKRLQTLAIESAQLFVRTSSAVEGRNGRLSLHHHALKTLQPDKLTALTAIHNFLIRRFDGTTAAERFFGQKPPDLMAHLVTTLPMLGRPAARRRRPHRKELTMAA